MLNRDLLIVRYKQPFVDWVNEADPHPDGHTITLEEANEDTPAYLIHEYASEDLENWLQECYLQLLFGLSQILEGQGAEVRCC